MTRFSDYDDFDGESEQILARRAALAALREALMALPEHRLVSGALCTVGDVDVRFPELSEEQAIRMAGFGRPGGDSLACRAQVLRDEQEEDRRIYSQKVAEDGHGVCVIGAYVWHRNVLDGADPDEAFAFLPSLTSTAICDPLDETARIGLRAGLACTLARELACRNDETYGRMTPEQRHAAFVAWIDERLAVPA